MQKVHYIDFVRQSNGSKIADSHVSNNVSASPLTGQEARKFYEELCLSSSQISEKFVDFCANNDLSSKSLVTMQNNNSRELCSNCTHENELVSNTVICEQHPHVCLDRNVSLVQSSHDLSSQPTFFGSAVHHVMKEDHKNARHSQRKRDHDKCELLRCAQNGDHERVVRLLEQGVDVNFADGFGWTAAMSAACEGHEDVLGVLALWDADFAILNHQGQTALSIAKLNGRTNVEEFLRTAYCDTKQFDDPLQASSDVAGFSCKTCNRNFTDIDQGAHSRSTLHLFNSAFKPNHDTFQISPLNAGYQIMLKAGWNGQSGLGPEGHGARFPLKTFLKKDRKGLGNVGRKRKKVAHFAPNDETAVYGSTSGRCRQPNAATFSKRAMKHKAKLELQKVIELRRELS